MDTPGRRRFLSVLAGLAAFLLPPGRRARAAIESLAPLVAKITGGAPLREGRVTLEMPRLADNGHSVPLTDHRGQPDDRRRPRAQHHTAVGEEPAPPDGDVSPGPEGGPARSWRRACAISTSQRVLVVAAMSDGSYWSGSAEVEVTESACLDAS